MEPKKIRAWVQVGLTIVFGLLGVWLIYTEPETSGKLKWAFGMVGLLFGYWLK